MAFGKGTSAHSFWDEFVRTQGFFSNQNVRKCRSQSNWRARLLISEKFCSGDQGRKGQSWGSFWNKKNLNEIGWNFLSTKKKNTPWIKQGKWELRSRCYQIQPRHLVRSFETFSHGSNAYLLQFFGTMAKWFGALAQNSQGFCCCCVLQQINKLKEIVFLKFTVTSPFGREGGYNFLYVLFAFLILFPKGFHDKFYRAVD